MTQKQPGDLVWYLPATVGYGYDYGTDPHGIPAVVDYLTPHRVVIHFWLKNEPATIVTRCVSAHNLLSRTAEASR